MEAGPGSSRTGHTPPHLLVWKRKPHTESEPVPAISSANPLKNSGEHMKLSKTTEPEARREANRLVKEYGITDPEGLTLIKTFAAAFSLELQCQRAIEQDGLTYLDRFNQPKSHVLLPTLRDSRAQKMQALKALGLDHEGGNNG